MSIRAYVLHKLDRSHPFCYSAVTSGRASITFATSQSLLKHFSNSGIYMGLFLFSAGAMGFFGSARGQTFGGFCGSSFIIASGLATLEVCANSVRPPERGRVRAAIERISPRSSPSRPHFTETLPLYTVHYRSRIAGPGCLPSQPRSEFQRTRQLHWPPHRVQGMFKQTPNIGSQSQLTYNRSTSSPPATSTA